MFKITNNTIEITRGDKCTIEFSIKDFEFGVGDKVYFRVYEGYKLDKEPVISKEIAVQETTTKVDIVLTSQDTKIGINKNRPVEYWYEISLNDNQTIIGYDDKGPKLFILYPEGE